MASGREPERTCAGCRTRSAKSALIRVAVAGGVCVVDGAGVEQSRGAYVHREMACVQAALEHGGLERALRVRLGAQEIARLRADIGRQL